MEIGDSIVDQRFGVSYICLSFVVEFVGFYAIIAKKLVNSKCPRPIFPLRSSVKQTVIIAYVNSIQNSKYDENREVN